MQTGNRRVPHRMSPALQSFLLTATELHTRCERCSAQDSLPREVRRPLFLVSLLRTSATYSRFLTTCFCVMMGDFDWKSPSVIGRIEAGLWFTSFKLLFVILWMNMLLTIVNTQS